MFLQVSQRSFSVHFTPRTPVLGVGGLLKVGDRQLGENLEKRLVKGGGKERGTLFPKAELGAAEAEKLKGEALINQLVVWVI